MATTEETPGSKQNCQVRALPVNLAKAKPIIAVILLKIPTPATAKGCPPGQLLVESLLR